MTTPYDVWPGNTLPLIVVVLKVPVQLLSLNALNLMYDRPLRIVHCRQQ